MKSFFASMMLLFCLTGALTACGQSGRLYLPDGTKPAIFTGAVQ